jgi:hypothetical protein
MESFIEEEGISMKGPREVLVHRGLLYEFVSYLRGVSGLD